MKWLVLVLAFPSAALADDAQGDAFADRGTPATLRAAIRDLMADFGPRYPSGDAFLRRLDLVEQQMSADMDAARAAFGQLQREALIANPLVSEAPLVFVERRQYAPDHHNTGTDFQPGEISAPSLCAGAALKTVDLGHGGQVQELLKVADGELRDLDVNYDGRRLVFAMRHNAQDSYHICEIQADGTELRQLTHSTPDTDVDPAYLPNGQIVFASTRDIKYCGCNRHVQANLFVMNADGANIRQISRNNLYDSRPSVMPDGRILYDRWEYVDRAYGPSFGLWTANPDGTQHALYYGNNAWSPGAIFDAQIIPGSLLCVAIFGSCHDRPWGALVILDRNRGLDGVEPVVQSWPGDIRPYLRTSTDYRQGQDLQHPVVGQIDAFCPLPVKYEDPYPLADPTTGQGLQGVRAGKYFLCSRMTGRAEQMGIYLVDTFGNEIVLHAEGPGCFDPQPLTWRPRPPVIPTQVDYAKNTGTFFVADVYQGTGMEQVPRGTIKTLRVVEAPPKRNWTGPMWNMDTFQAPAMNYNCTSSKRILGDAPVESDGSAHFEVPADKFIFFQALDADGLMVQSMRSGTTIQPGERAGCTGCHENRLSSAGLPSNMPLAMRRPPSQLQPWYGPPREFNYLTEVQPVFDRHCVRCHDYGNPDSGDLNLAGDLGLVFNTSYLELHRKSALRWFADPPDAAKLLIKAVHDGPPEVLPAYAWGSHRSRLVEVLRAKHYDVQLDRESFDRIVTWIDMNAPYYGSYYSVYRDHVYGRAPLDDAQMARLAELTGLPYQVPSAHVGLNQQKIAGNELCGSQVNFTRPALSPCLAKFADKNDPRCLEALAIIRAGQERLARQPREDMLGAQAVPVAAVDVARNGRCQARSCAETTARQAILAGRQVLDE
ncbi:MAG: HzsA-related protein [Pirellulaceae bacterium]